MSAPMDTSSDSSIDEDEAKRLKEASVDGIVNAFKKDDKTQQSQQIHDKSKNRNGVSTTKPSMRHNLESRKDNFDGNINTTPQVREFIAKKLSTALDQSIELLKGIKEKTVNKDEDKNDDEGFHMFSRTTQKQLDILREAKRQRITEAQKRRQAQKEISSDSSDEEARLAEAAVSAEFIFEQSGIKTNRVYTKETNGPDGNSDLDTTLARSNSLSQEATEEMTAKHKKKKKRKSSCEENETTSNLETVSDTCSVKKKKRSKHKDIETC